MSHIIDVSQFQGIPDFKELKREGVLAVYIKCTEGRTFVSPTFHEQWRKAGEAKLIRGSYHFARQDLHPQLTAEATVTTQREFPLGSGYMGRNYSTDEPPKASLSTVTDPIGGAEAEAHNYIRTMLSLGGRHEHAWHKGELHPLLDFEVGTPDHHYSPWRNEFFRVVRARTNHATILYTFPAFNKWAPPPRLSPNLMIADFRGRSHPEIPDGYSHYQLWQYTSHGQIPGIRGLVDLSRLAPGVKLNSLRCHING